MGIPFASFSSITTTSEKSVLETPSQLVVAANKGSVLALKNVDPVAIARGPTMLLQGATVLQRRQKQTALKEIEGSLLLEQDLRALIRP